MEEKKISVVTCLWNNMKYWTVFYESLKEMSTKIDEIVVVDNGSEDGAERIEKECPDVRFIRLEQNTFEGGGVARAMKEATGDLVFKCDPDIRFVFNRWEEAMIEELKRDGVGAVVPEPYFWPVSEHSDGFVEASVLVGTLFLIKREVLDRVGVWDPDLKYGTNEFDYALRMRRAGYSIAVGKVSPIVHYNHHARMREIGVFDVGPLIEESWGAFHAKIGTRDYWAIPENRKFKGEWDERSEPPAA